MRTKSAVLALFILSGSVVSAGLPTESSMHGVWQGTLGDQQIRVCLDSFEPSYYYLRHSWGIPLYEVDADRKSLVETSKENPTGVWTLNLPIGNRLEGQWSDAQGKRAKPIRLTRVTVISKNTGSCSGEANGYVDAYNVPRVSSQRITVGAIKEFEGKRYREVSAAKQHVTTIELLEDGESLARINSSLHDKLTRGIAGYFECQTSLERDGGGKDRDPNFGVEVQLKFWNSRWMSVVETNSWEAAGRGPIGNRFPTTWDIATGKEVMLWGWVKHPKVENDQDPSVGSPSQELVREIESQMHDKCSVHDGKYKLGLGKKGIVFFTLESGRGLCTDEIEIPYQRLQRFLTKEGKAAVQLILNDTFNQTPKIGNSPK